MTDILIFIPILILVMLLFYLSNREMKKSLEQSKISARVLAQDSNALRMRLRESEIARLHELTKAAEFGRLAQGLFHDLMTPLTSVILHTEKLKDSDATKKSLLKAVEAGTRMTQYVQDIRSALSREGAEAECNLTSELECILHLHAYKIKTSGVAVHTDDADTTLAWHGNPIKIRQVFSNLISNALDSFDTPGSDTDFEKKIHIMLKKDASEIEGIRIEIKDNGSGISPQNMQKIFEPFFTTKSTNKGTGIGLTTVKMIVEKDMKGKIEIESEEGKGTLVRIIFPVCSPLHNV